MADNNANGSQAGQGDQSQQQDQASTNTQQSQADQSNQNNSNQSSSIKNLDEALKVIEELRKEAAANRTKVKTYEANQAKAEKERQEAEQAKLKEQGQWQKLAEDSQAEMSKLKPVVEKYGEVTNRLLTRTREEIKGWPKEAKDLLPSGDEVDALDYLNAFDRIKPLAQKLMGQGQGQQNNSGQGRANGWSPKPVGSNGPKTADEYYNDMKLSGRYNA
jgi:uncharacterized protein YhaN